MAQMETLFRDFKKEVSEDFSANGREHDRLREEIHRERTERQNENAKVWMALDALRNRLPLWATILISVLVALISVALTFAGTIAIRMIFDT